MSTLASNGSPLVVEYQTKDVKTEIISPCPVSYTVWDKGVESIIQGDTDNSIYGANPIITQTYSIVENPTEAANKAYVNNGLSKKLDKLGGTITGSLIVENGTNTTLPALVVNNNGVMYGLTYDSDDEAYKLGQGTVNKDNDFSFNENEGSPICLRDDSEELDHGDLLMWDADKKKLVKSGITKDDIMTLLAALAPQ